MWQDDFSENMASGNMASGIVLEFPNYTGLPWL